MFNSKKAIGTAYLIIALSFFVGCSSKQELSSELLNQDNCALMNGDKLKIINGNIIRLPLKELMGEAFPVNSDTVKITDDLNQSRFFKLKKQSKDGKTLLTIWWDENNILFACAVK